MRACEHSDAHPDEFLVTIRIKKHELAECLRRMPQLRLTGRAPARISGIPSRATPPSGRLARDVRTGFCREPALADEVDMLRALMFRLGMLLLLMPSLATAQASFHLGLAPAADYSPVYPSDTFPSKATEFAAIFHLAPGENYRKLTASWIAVDVGGVVAPNHVVLTREQALGKERVGAFRFRTNAAPPGKHRIEVRADGQLWKTADFEVVEMPENSARPEAEGLFPLETGAIWRYNMIQEAGEGAKLEVPAGAELDSDGRFRATVIVAVTGKDSIGAHVEWRRGEERIEEEWLRLDAEGLVRTQRIQEGKPVVLTPPELLLPHPNRHPPKGAWEAPAYAYQLRYRVWGPLPLRGPDGIAPGYVTLAIYPPPFETTVERHYLPGMGLVREVLVGARGGRRLQRQELVLRDRSRSRDSTRTTGRGTSQCVSGGAACPEFQGARAAP